MSAFTAYGDITPRTAAYAAVNLLKRGIPFYCFEKFGQAQPVPKKKSDTIVFRRYEALDPTPNALTEGVTPTAKKLTKTDIPATLTQYGDLVEITDRVEDFHEDPILKTATDILGEQAAEMLETARFNILKAGTNVVYSGTATQRTEVVAPMALATQRKVLKALKRQNARPITSVLRTGPAFNTEPVAAAWIAVCHPDLQSDLEDIDGWVPTEKYGQTTPYEMEMGKIGQVRYLATTVAKPWEGAGAASTDVENDGANADVYPIIFIARDAYGLVALKGKNAIKPMVTNPGTPTKSDPLGQRGSVGWKTYSTTVILQDAWMSRAEVACSL